MSPIEEGIDPERPRPDKLILVTRLLVQVTPPQIQTIVGGGVPALQSQPALPLPAGLRAAASIHIALSVSFFL